MNSHLQERDEILPCGTQSGHMFKNLVNVKLLQDAIGNVIGGRSAAQTMPVRTFTDHRALIAHVLRFGGGADDVFDAAAILLILAQVGAPAAPDNGLLHVLFDLTPAEARLLRALAGGSRLQSYAASVGVQVEGDRLARSALDAVYNLL